MKTPLQYAEELLLKHDTILEGWLGKSWFTGRDRVAKESALLDVGNTIKAISQIPKYATDSKYEKMQEFYKEVKKILETE